MKNILIFIIAFSYYSVFSQSAETNLTLSGGISPIEFSFGQEKEKLNILNISAKIQKNILNNLYIGLKYSKFTYSKTENPDQLSLVFNGDLSNVTYGNPFFQETTNVSYHIPSIELSYVLELFDRLDWFIIYSINYINGLENRTRISSVGNNEPTIVGYSTKERSEFSFLNFGSSIMLRLSPSLKIGFSYDYFNVLEYNNLSVVLSAQIK